MLFLSHFTLLDAAKVEGLAAKISKVRKRLSLACTFMNCSSSSRYIPRELFLEPALLFYGRFVQTSLVCVVSLLGRLMGSGYQRLAFSVFCALPNSAAHFKLLVLLKYFSSP